MARLGSPSNIAAMSRAQRVSAPLPQGDPWRPAALCAALVAPVKHTRALHPEVHQQLFLDDRKWESGS
eukprot:6823660-Pyramimonas_sp.AAC.1